MSEQIPIEELLKSMDLFFDVDEELAGIHKQLLALKNDAAEMLSLFEDYLGSLIILRGARRKALNVISEKYDSKWSGKDDFCHILLPAKASMDKFISNVQKETIDSINAQIGLYDSCLEKIEKCQEDDCTIGDLKRKLDAQQNMTERDEAEISEIKKQLSHLESIRTSTMNFIREYISKFAESWILHFSNWVIKFMSNEAIYHKFESSVFYDWHSVAVQLFQSASHENIPSSIEEGLKEWESIMKDNQGASTSVEVVPSDSAVDLIKKLHASFSPDVPSQGNASSSTTKVSTFFNDYLAQEDWTPTKAAVAENVPSNRPDSFIEKFMRDNFNTQ